MRTVTVIVVSFNAESCIKDCLYSLKQQTITPTRIIVVDNASSDRTVTLAESFSGIEIIQMDQNVGFSAANNLAIAQCETHYIALLNPDAIAHPDWLEKLLVSAAEHPECGSWGARQMIYNADDIVDGLGDVYHISGLAWRHRYGKKLSGSDLLPKYIFSSCACAALYDRQKVIHVGGFDEDFFCYFEDVDLGFRLQLAGYSSMYVPNAVVQHIGSYSSGEGKNNDFALYHGHRNLVWTFIKNMPTVLFLIFLPLHILLNFFSVFYFLFKGKGGTIFKSKVDAFKNIGNALKKRRSIQHNRILSELDTLKLLTFFKN